MELGAFIAVSILVIVIPGPDTALVTRNALIAGRRGGFSTCAGTTVGLVIWSLAASLGVAALLRASEPAFLALKIAGGAYLVYLGVVSLMGGIRGRAPEAPAPRDGKSRPVGLVAFRQGVLSNLGNPKIAVFFTSFLPQFVSTDSATFAVLLALGLLFAALTFVWLSFYSVVVARAGDVLRRPRARRMLDAITGVVLAGFGVLLATERS